MAHAAGDSHEYPIYGYHFRLIFPILDNDGDLVSAAAGLDSEVSKDAGTPADCTNEATEIGSSGMYYLDLTGAEMAAKSVAGVIKTTTTDAKTTPFVLYPKRLPALETGTAQAGAAGTITLSAGASAKDDFYNGMFVGSTNDNPSGVDNQIRRIVDYNGTTKVATIESDWGTNPSSSTTYEILVPETTQVGGWNGKTAAEQDSDGYPVVTVKDGSGAGEINTNAGKIVEVETLTGHTAQTGDSYARLGAPAGASHAADLADIESKVDDLEGRLTAARAGYLDELAAANIPADVDTLLSRLTAARAGYLDNLNGHTAQTGDNYARLGAPTGVSHAADIADIEGKVDDLEGRLTAARAGYLDNLNGHTAQTGDSYARLGAPAGASVSADIAAAQADLDNPNQYKADVSSLATVANQTTILARLGDFGGTGLNTVKGFFQALFRSDAGVTGANTPSEINEVENSTAGTYDGASDSAEAIVADLATINGLVDDLEGRLTAARAGYLDELGSANIPADIDTLIARLTAARAGYLDNLSGHTAQTGDNYARLGAPAGASHAADIADIESKVDDLEGRLTAARATNLDNLDATVSSRSTFDETTDEVDVGKVKGTALTETSSGRIAGNMSTFYDNADAATSQTVDDVGGGTSLTQQNVRDAMKLAPTAGSPASGSVDEHLDTIEGAGASTSKNLVVGPLKTGGGRLQIDAYLEQSGAIVDVSAISVSITEVETDGTGTVLYADGAISRQKQADNSWMIYVDGATSIVPEKNYRLDITFDPSGTPVARRAAIPFP